jgi:hypothetical protein
MFVTGGPPVRSGRGIPQRMIVRSRPPSALVAKFSVYHSKECSDGGLGCSTDGIPRPHSGGGHYGLAAYMRDPPHHALRRRGGTCGWLLNVVLRRHAWRLCSMARLSRGIRSMVSNRAGNWRSCLNSTPPLAIGALAALGFKLGLEWSNTVIALSSACACPNDDPFGLD